MRRPPRSRSEQTFERYWTFFSDRRDGRQPWEAFTPYELRTVGAFVRLGWRQRALEMLEFFLAYCRPEGWLQWPEVVWKDPRSPRFLGDLPHAWVAAEYIRSVLDLFAYDREADQSLVIGAGIPKEWTGPLGYVDVFGLRTPYGPLAYTVTRQADAYEVRILQGLRVPPGGIAVRAPFDGPIRRATVDGHETAPNAAGEVIVRAVPARVVLEP